MKGILLVTLLLTPSVTEAYQKYSRELCEEVRVELSAAVKRGDINEGEMRELMGRCRRYSK